MSGEWESYNPFDEVSRFREIQDVEAEFYPADVDA